MRNKVLMVVLGVAIGGVAHAAGQPVPHTFTAGQKAVASEVNEDFQDLADRIADVSQQTDLKAATSDVNASVQSLTSQILDLSQQLAQKAAAADVNASILSLTSQITSLSQQLAQKASTTDLNTNVQTLTNQIAALPGGTVLNLSDFSQPANMTAKTFQITSSPIGCSADTRTYARTVNGNITTIVEADLGTKDSGATPCFNITNTLQVDSSGLGVVQVDTRDPNTLAITSSQSFSPSPLLYLPVQFSKGSTWSGETVLFQSSNGSFGILLTHHTLIGLENVNVPAGSFANCLKIFRYVNFAGNPSSGRVEWRCPGVGLVKQFDTSVGISELTSTTPPLQ